MVMQKNIIKAIKDIYLKFVAFFQSSKFGIGDFRFCLILFIA